MLTGVRIRNFRLFRDLEIDGLARVNLFVGNNQAGKTTLLEALFLLADAGRPLMRNRGNVLRSPIGAEAAPAYATLWKQWFPGGDTSRTMRMDGCHTALGHTELIVEVSEAAPTDTADGMLSLKPGTADLMKLVFRYRDRLRAQWPHKGCLHVHNGGEPLCSSQSMFPPLPPAVLLPAHPGHDREDARRLDDLPPYLRDAFLLPALQSLKPELQAVVVHPVDGEPEEIRCDLGLAQPQPLGALGAGTAAVARLVLAIAAAAGSTVLADQIDHGVHHATLDRLWRILFRAVRERDVQLFATTHSWECIHAAYAAADNAADGDLRLFRIESDPLENRVVAYKPEALEAALAHGIEVR